MRYDEKKKDFKSRVNILENYSKESTNNEYLAGLNSILAKMVEQKEDNVTHLSKPKPPPSRVSESFSRYKEQVLLWSSHNKDNEYNKYHDLMEKLKQNKDIYGLREFVSSTVTDQLKNKG